MKKKAFQKLTQQIKKQSRANNRISQIKVFPTFEIQSTKVTSVSYLSYKYLIKIEVSLASYIFYIKKQKVQPKYFKIAKIQLTWNILWDKRCWYRSVGVHKLYLDAEERRVFISFPVQQPTATGGFWPKLCTSFFFSLLKRDAYHTRENYYFSLIM